MVKSADKKTTTLHYRLRRDFKNGSMVCKAGSIQPFPEGKQPLGAEPVTVEELKAEAVMQEGAQDVFVKRLVEKHLAKVLPELVADAVEEALAAASAEEGANVPSAKVVSPKAVTK